MRIILTDIKQVKLVYPLFSIGGVFILANDIN